MASGVQLAGTILVVEDDSSVRQVFERLIGRLMLNHQIIAVADAPAALTLIGRQPIVLALIDYAMPGINGLQLTGLIKERSPTTRIVVMSAVGDSDLPTRALSAGVRPAVVRQREIGFRSSGDATCARFDRRSRRAGPAVDCSSPDARGRPGQSGRANWWSAAWYGRG
jgi:two-component system, chemotaxis family, chemotaxis protein CheY